MISTAKRFYGKGIPGIVPSHLSGKLIVIEGADGSGRSTQIGTLRDWLERLGYPTVEVGLTRSILVAEELEEAKEMHFLCPFTLSLFYATDFADQLENKIIPALRSGFVVLADRYIYTLMARAIVRGVDPQWIKDVYGIALIPDVIFYLQVGPKTLAERNLHKNGVMNYWESGMDTVHGTDMYDSFIKYQREIHKVFQLMQAEYKFEIINGNLSRKAIWNELQAKAEYLLHTR